jgi:hypothetical protein
MAEYDNHSQNLGIPEQKTVSLRKRARVENYHDFSSYFLTDKLCFSNVSQTLRVSGLPSVLRIRIFIPDPKFSIPDPGSRVKKTPDPGSRSASKN